TLRYHHQRFRHHGPRSIRTPRSTTYLDPPRGCTTSAVPRFIRLLLGWQPKRTRDHDRERRSTTVELRGVFGAVAINTSNSHLEWSSAGENVSQIRASSLPAATARRH